MRYYHIEANGLAGVYFVSNESYNQGLPLGLRVLYPDTFDIPPAFFETFGADFFVTDAFKKELQEAGFTELTFNPIDHLLLDPHRVDFFSEHSITEKSFWKVYIPSTGIVQDFFLWDKRFLVVSEKALDFLRKHKGYEDEIRWKNFGPAFEILTNFYPIDVNIDAYFNHQYKLDKAYVDQKVKNGMDEYRKRAGLPPLP